MVLTEYNHSSFKLFKTANTIFKTFNLFEFFKLKNEKKYPLIKVGEQSGLIITIDEEKYVFALNLEGLESRLYVAKLKKLDSNNITWNNIKYNAILNVEVNIEPLIDFTIENSEGEDKKKNIDTKKKYIEIIYGEPMVFGYSSYIEFDIELVRKIFTILNTPCDEIIKVMKEEVEEYIQCLENDLTILFNNIPSYMEKNKQYHYGDADYTAEILTPDHEDEILIGYNNVVSCDEFFMLLRKKGKQFSVTLETFSNFKKIDGYKEIEYLDGFENNENIELIKQLPLSYSTGNKEIRNFSRIAFDVNCLAHSLLEEEPC